MKWNFQSHLLLESVATILKQECLAQENMQCGSEGHILPLWVCSKFPKIFLFSFFFKFDKKIFMYSKFFPIY
jgi:hypothetical protein